VLALLVWIFLKALNKTSYTTINKNAATNASEVILF
tara:strand:- start:927 stop:1034 length:108 start_codon:yes stop_codon:yes gene_type:complete